MEMMYFVQSMADFPKRSGLFHLLYCIKFILISSLLVSPAEAENLTKLVTSYILTLVVVVCVSNKSMLFSALIISMYRVEM
jgi:hypothetical protein